MTNQQLTDSSPRTGGNTNRRVIAQGVFRGTFSDYLTTNASIIRWLRL